jgi:hypothetical protein
MTTVAVCGLRLRTAAFSAGQLAVVLLLASAAGAMAQGAASGGVPTFASANAGCDADAFTDSHYLLNGMLTFDDSRHAAYSLRLNTPVFQDATGDTPGARTLRFGERVVIADPGKGSDRLKVKDDAARPLGWVARSVMLCSDRPVKDPATGLKTRVVVGTQIERGQRRATQLFQTPATSVAERCEAKCAEASEAQWFFVYAEENDHYLISGASDLRSNRATLEGWIAKTDVFVWSTGLGLRPREDLPRIPATPPRTDSAEGFICVYRSEEDLANNTNCNRILGGRRWFGLDQRIPVLQVTPQYYEVVFPGVDQSVPKEPQNKTTSECLGMSLDCASNARLARGFIKADGAVVPEVLLSRDEVDHWLRILNVFKAFPPSESRTRDALVSSWMSGISDIVQVPLESRALTMGAAVQLASGLPNGARSKLMQYPDGMLRNINQVPDCEIDYLKQYASQRYDVLNIVYQSDGRMRPIFHEATRPSGACAKLSQVSKDFTSIDGAIRPEALNRPSEQTSYSMMHPRSGVQLFWMPVSYLP